MISNLKKRKNKDHIPKIHIRMLLLGSDHQGEE